MYDVMSFVFISGTLFKIWNTVQCRDCIAISMNLFIWFVLFGRYVT